MLAAVSTVSFLVQDMVLFIYRVRQITEATRAGLVSEAQNLALRTELVLAGMETQLELVSSLLLADADEQNLQFILSRTADKNSPVSAVYQLDKNGTVVRAAVKPLIDERRRQELLGNDYSRVPHVTNLRESVIPVWSEDASPTSATRTTVAVGARVGEGGLIAEVPLEYILGSLQTSKGAGEAAVWLLDNKGEMLADSEDSSRVGVVNVSSEPLFREASSRWSLAGQMRFEGRNFDAAVARTGALNWFARDPIACGAGQPGDCLHAGTGFCRDGGAALLGPCCCRRCWRCGWRGPWPPSPDRHAAWPMASCPAPGPRGVHWSSTTSPPTWTGMASQSARPRA